MFFLFVLINTLLYFLAVLFRNKIFITSSWKLKAKYPALEKTAYYLVAIAAIYILLFNVLFGIYLIGTYTDIVIGLMIIAYLDFLYIAVPYHSRYLLRSVYRFVRPAYVTFNVIRVLLYFLVGYATGGGIPIAYPVENMHRTKDLKVFNKFYFNATENPYTLLYKEEIRLYKAKFLLFKKKVLTYPGYAYNNIHRSEIKFFNSDSIYIYQIRTYLFKRDEHYYIHYRDPYRNTVKVD